MSLVRRSTIAACAVALTAATVLPNVGSNAANGPQQAPAKAPAAPTLPTTGLDILIGNDDGWDAAGIQATKDALEAAGHHVTMAAPDTNNSGVSAKVSFSGNVTVVEQAPGEWSVSSSPVSSMLFGMEQLFIKEKGAKPDLVISGSNVGANAGFDTNYSGTVGVATVAAGAYDVPAIAISTDVSYGQEAQGAYTQTADFLVDLIKKGVPDLPRGQFLNINYPNLGKLGTTAPKGVKFASNAQASLAAFGYEKLATPDAAGNNWKVKGARSTEVPATGSDLALLAEGYVTVSLLDADRSMPESEAPDVASLLRRINGQPEPVPPTPPVVKPSVEALPKVVAGGSIQWIKAKGLNGTRVVVTWKPLKKGLKTGVRTPLVAEGVFKLRARVKPGKYQVKVASKGKTLRTSVMKVL